MFRICASVFCVAALEGVALAQICVPQGGLSGDLLKYRICNVPDIDQRRANNGIVPGLPNEGKMYCVPTSAMNWLAYIANHGLPSVLPGAGNWGPEAYPAEPHYHTMTSALNVLGFMMSTDQNDGTYLGPAKSALQVVLNPLLFVVSAYGTTSFYTPRFSEMAHSALSGAFIIPGVGWYKTFAELPPEIQAFLASQGFPTSGYFRAGGHMMSLVSASINGSAAEMGVHNPATDSTNLVQQSTFNMETYPIQALSDQFDFDSRTMDRVVGLGSGILDNYISIRPLVALTTDEFLIHPLKSTRTYESIDLTELHAGGRGYSAAGIVTALAVHPEGVRHPYLVQNDDTIWQLDTLTGLSSRFATVPHPRQIVFGGPDQRLHVLGDRRIVSLDLNGRTVAEVAVDDSVEAITYDTRENRVIAVAPGLPGAPGRLLRFNSKLEPAGASSIPPIPCAAGLLLKDDPVTGSFWLACRGSSELTLLQPSGIGIMVPSPVTLESPRPVEDFAVASSGHLYVTDGRELRVYDSNGRRVRSSPLDGQKAGPIVDVLRSFSNFDPARMRNPQYRNVLPE